MPTGLTADALNQEILQVSSQLLESSRQAQQNRIARVKSPTP